MEIVSILMKGTSEDEILFDADVVQCEEAKLCIYINDYWELWQVLSGYTYELI